MIFYTFYVLFVKKQIILNCTSLKSFIWKEIISAFIHTIIIIIIHNDTSYIIP